MTPQAYCQQKAAKSGSSFYYSFLFLTESQRQALTALYAFCREVDDIADDITDAQVARHKLTWWREEINRLYQQCPQHPVTQALAPVVTRYHLEQQWFEDLIIGMQMDLNFQLFESDQDLHQYCYYAAGVVGIMAAHIFGFQSEATLTYAKNLGIALQLINIIRDLREDADRGRVYIPTDTLLAHGIAPEDIIANRCPSQKIAALLARQATQAQDFYQTAMTALPAIDRYPQRCGLIMANIYFSLLKEIEKSQFNVMTHRISLTPVRKLWIAWSTIRKEKKLFKQQQKQYARS